MEIVASGVVLAVEICGEAGTGVVVWTMVTAVISKTVDKNSFGNDIEKASSEKESDSEKKIPTYPPLPYVN